jgi:hypothetical protein
MNDQIKLHAHVDPIAMLLGTTLRKSIVNRFCDRGTVDLASKAPAVPHFTQEAGPPGPWWGRGGDDCVDRGGATVGICLSFSGRVSHIIGTEGRGRRGGKSWRDSVGSIAPRVERKTMGNVENSSLNQVYYPSTSFVCLELAGEPSLGE